MILKNNKYIEVDVPTGYRDLKTKEEAVLN